MCMYIGIEELAANALIGTWGDKRETEEIAKDIYAARTLGREVNLWHYGRIEGLVIENWLARQR